jgi:hypothetical protein
MREYDDYDDENIRLYTPVLQRVIILAAVIIAVPVLMWTITTFIRSYIARPAVPALEHVASTNMPAGLPANSPAPRSRAPADQSAPQHVEGASASDAPSPAAETKNGPSNVASLSDTSASPAAANSLSGASLQTAPVQAPSPAIPASAATAGDTSGGAPSSIGSMPRLPPAPRSTDNAALTSPPSSLDRGLAWPNPNTTSPPDFSAPRLPPPPAPARIAAAEAFPADEPIRGPIPLPRQRPGIVVIAAGGSVPLPRARPGDAPAAATGTIVEMPAGGRSELETPH